MSNVAGTRAPGVSRRTGLVVVAGAALIVLAVFIAVCVRSGDGLTMGPEVPAVGTPTEPVCPADFGADLAAPSTRKGPLLPTGATAALLCSYQFGAPKRPLTGTHRITSGAEAVVAYLNRLTGVKPKPYGCLLGGTTAHVMVFGYTNRPAAAVYARGCAWDQAGAVRYDGDLRTVTGFWGVPWNQ